MILNPQIHFGFQFNLTFVQSVNGSLGVGTRTKKCPILPFKNHHGKEMITIILLVLVEVLKVVTVSAQCFEWEHLRGKKITIILSEFFQVNQKMISLEFFL